MPRKNVKKLEEFGMQRGTETRRERRFEKLLYLGIRKKMERKIGGRFF
jgi:hypothetical protein